MSPSTTLSFGQLFGNSVDMLKNHIRTVLVFAIIAAAFSALSQASAFLLPFAVDEVTGTVDMAQISPLFFVLFFALQLLAIFVMVLFQMSFWVLAVRGGGWRTALTGGLGILLPMIGLWLWILIRAYAWVALIGMLLIVIGVAANQPMLAALGVPLYVASAVLLIIFGPRFIAAPYLYVSGKSGVLESVQLSYAGTKGFWGKIVGNMLLFMLCAAAVSFVGGMLGALFSIIALTGTGVSTAVTVISMAAFMILLSIVQWCVVAFGVFFTKELSATVMGV